MLLSIILHLFTGYNIIYIIIDHVTFITSLDLISVLRRNSSDHLFKSNRV